MSESHAGGRKTQNPENDAEDEAIQIPPNIDLTAFTREVEYLTAIEPAAILKGLMLECRELARGAANRLVNPRLKAMHPEFFDHVRGATRMASELAETLAKLDGTAPVEERVQRIVVERIARTLPAALPPQGEGGARIPKNE